MKDNYSSHHTKVIGGHRFYLGTDRLESERRASVIQMLLRDNAIATREPRWCNLTLSFARQVAAGISEFLWPPDDGDETPEDYATFVDSLRAMFPSLQVIPADAEMYAAGVEQSRVIPAWEPQRPTRRRGIRINTVTNGNCIELLDRLPDDSVSLMLCSPPYAEQRKGRYPGVSAENCPEWTVAWMSKLWPKLTSDGSVLIVIDPHVKNGRESDYVLRTQLSLEEAGWNRARQNVWFKPDSFPLGRGDWPRHSYESILWFTKSPKPFCAPKADRLPPVRKKQDYSTRKWIASGSQKNATVSRVSDVHSVAVGSNARGVSHTAMFPQPLAERLIKAYCPEGGTVLDCFCGSGTTLLAAKALGRRYYGFDIMPEYCDIARKRLKVVKRPKASA